MTANINILKIRTIYLICPIIIITRETGGGIRGAEGSSLGSLALHGILAVFALSRLAYFLAGVAVRLESDSEFFQFIDPQLMKTQLLRSLFFLHMQPPGLNLAAGAILKSVSGRLPGSVPGDLPDHGRVDCIGGLPSVRAVARLGVAVPWADRGVRGQSRRSAVRELAGVRVPDPAVASRRGDLPVPIRAHGRPPVELCVLWLPPGPVDVAEHVPSGYLVLVTGILFWLMKGHRRAVVYGSCGPLALTFALSLKELASGGIFSSSTCWG